MNGSTKVLSIAEREKSFVTDNVPGNSLGGTFRIGKVNILKWMRNEL